MDTHALVRRFLAQRDELLGFLLFLSRDPAVAEEVFQEVALAVMEEAERGTEVVNVAAWTREIARRRLAAYWHEKGDRRARERSLVELGDRLAEACAEEGADEMMATVRSALPGCLERLARHARQLIELRYGGRQGIAEIAAIMHWSTGAVKVALSRARSALNGCLERRLHGQES